MMKRMSKAQPVNQMKPKSVNRNLEPHEVALSSAARSSINVLTWSEYFAGEPDTAKVLDGVLNQIKELKDGDMRRVEAMLYGHRCAGFAPKPNATNQRSGLTRWPDLGG